MNKPKPADKMNHVFISWGGDDAREIADWLHKNIFGNIPAMDCFYSEKVPTGTLWRKNLDDYLQAATHGLGILTDEALTRPWFLYEMFVLRDRLQKVPVLRFGDKVSESNPLSELQMANGFEFSSVCEVAEMLLKGQEPLVQRLALDKIKEQKTAWVAKVSDLAKKQRKMANLQHSIATVTRTITDSTLYPTLEGNACMRELAGKALNDLDSAFQGLTHSVPQEFRLDLSRYPEYLIHLQSSLRCKTLAVAVVNAVEEFWAQQTGREILAVTQEGSQRIFIFEDAEALRSHWGALKNHGERYQIAVMSKGSFDMMKKHHKIDGDFSILTARDTADEICAYYDRPSRSIKFTASNGQVITYRRAFEQLWALARPFPPSPEADSKIESFIQEVFNAHTGVLHHSHAIPIDLYDTSEEDHPFYREMHARMLAEFRSYCRSKQGMVFILEIGAGTGHFTKRLPQQRQLQQQTIRMQITALEPDPKARVRLKEKLARLNIQIQERSALDLSEAEQYDFIFSSFSEHHIKPEEKQKYFANIRRALKPGGYFIIGDEFLPPHNVADDEDYVKALGRYHSYIIQEAEKHHYTDLIVIEKLAWQSGMPDELIRVDYKTTIDNYLRKAQDCHLHLVSSHCISPGEQYQSVGGIYVAVFDKSD